MGLAATTSSPVACPTRPNMVLQAVFTLVILGHCIGYELYDDGKRQDLYPFPRIGRGHWAWIEDKRQGLMPFPRVGRNEEKRQGLIPFPRIGRSSEEEDDDFQDLAGDDFGYFYYYASPPVMKRGPLAFTPRIGRRKRSVNEEDDPQRKSEDNKAFLVNPWQVQDSEDYDYGFVPRDLVPLPRYGRRAFIPRVGKKSDSQADYAEDSKRALAFTPRIGRAALIPRIGRSDSEFSVSSRAAFTPRIGRAALVPRIGRASLTPRIGRGAFVPRIGRSEKSNATKSTQKSS